MQPTKADYVALGAFRRALRRFLSFAEARAREAGITPQQHHLLLAIASRPHREWSTAKELAEGLQLRHNAVVGLANRCERSGLVVRTPDPEDHRVVRLWLSERGRRVLAEVTASNLAEIGSLARLAGELEALAEGG